MYARNSTHPPPCGRSQRVRSNLLKIFFPLIFRIILPKKNSLKIYMQDGVWIYAWVKLEFVLSR